MGRFGQMSLSDGLWSRTLKIKDPPVLYTIFFMYKKNRFARFARSVICFHSLAPKFSTRYGMDTHIRKIFKTFSKTRIFKEFSNISCLRSKNLVTKYISIPIPGSAILANAKGENTVHQYDKTLVSWYNVDTILIPDISTDNIRSRLWVKI